MGEGEGGAYSRGGGRLFQILADERGAYSRGTLIRWFTVFAFFTKQEMKL